MSAPNKILGSSSDLVCLPEPQVCEAPLFVEELVCRADSYSESSALAATPRPSVRSIFEDRLRVQLSQATSARRTQVVASAFGSTAAPHSTSASEGLALSPLFPLTATGCANSGPIDDAPDPDPTTPPPDDNPPVVTGGENGGLGAGIQAMFGTSACHAPSDLDLASVAGSVILTCSDTSGAGNGILEIFNAASGGSPTVRSLPAFLGGAMSKPIRLTSSTAGDGGIIYAGFTTSRSVATLESETAPNFDGVVPSLLNSGIYTTNEAGTGSVGTTLFDQLQVHPSGSSVIPISLAGFGGGDATVLQIQPNTPISLFRMGNRVIVLNNNRQVNPVGGSLDFAPISVHRYTINASTGALVPEAASDEFSAIVKAGTSTRSNAMLLDGYYNATGAGAIDSSRFAVVVQGLPGVGVDSSGILVYNAETLAAGLPNDPDREGSYISFSDAPDPETPKVDFVASDSPTVPVINSRYALVGSLDGRIAIVDCDNNAVAPGVSRVRYIRAFDSGAIEAIVPDATGAFAYVVSRGETGQRSVRAVTLTEGPNFGRVGESFPFFNGTSPSAESDVVFNTNFTPAVYAADSVIAAHDGAYAKAPIAAH